MASLMWEKLIGNQVWFLLMVSTAEWIQYIDLHLRELKYVYQFL